MEKINIHGKDYITVNARLKEFARVYPNGCIVTKVIKQEGDEVIFQAVVMPDVNTPTRFFTGHARELSSSSYINKTSHMENCETSAVGRALGMLGIGIDTSIASAEEVQNAVNNQIEKADKNYGVGF